LKVKLDKFPTREGIIQELLVICYYLLVYLQVDIRCNGCKQVYNVFGVHLFPPLQEEAEEAPCLGFFPALNNRFIQRSYEVPVRI